MPPEPWFRARHPRGEPGFRVIHWKGFAVTVGVIVVVASLLVGPLVVFGRQPLLLIGGGALTVAAVAGFVALVRARTEDWRE